MRACVRASSGAIVICPIQSYGKKVGESVDQRQRERVSKKEREKTDMRPHKHSRRFLLLSPWSLKKFSVCFCSHRESVNLTSSFHIPARGVAPDDEGRVCAPNSQSCQGKTDYDVALKVSLFFGCPRSRPKKNVYQVKANCQRRRKVPIYPEQRTIPASQREV